MSGPTPDQLEKANGVQPVNRTSQYSVARGIEKRPEDRSMSPRCAWRLAIVMGLSVVPAARASEEMTPARRGERALLGRSFLPGTLSITAYDSVWRVWSDDAKTPPKDFPNALMDRYGLHPSP